MSDFLTPIERNAAFAPGKTAIRFEGESWTYAHLAARARAMAERLARDGVGHGDRVAVLAYNHPDTFALLYACSRLGAIVCPLNWRLADAELAWAIGHAEPAMLVHGPGFAGRAEGLSGPFVRRGMAAAFGADADGDPPLRGTMADPCVMIFTSGTTGRPKAALLAQGAMKDNAVQSFHLHQMSADDQILSVLPLFHSGALNIQNTPALMMGATVTLHPRFDAAQTLAAIVADRPTLSLLVPATLTALMALEGFEAADLSSLRAISTGSTIVPADLIDAYEARGIPILCVYGSTETLPIAAYDRLGLPRTRGATGRAGVLGRIVIMDEAGAPLPSGTRGEIGVIGPCFSGYFRDPAATAAAFHGDVLRTGDSGSVDRDGALTVHDRIKDIIISGGENIYPAEVERVMLLHPAVAECAVVGVPHPRWQEVPLAYVVFRSPCDPQDLIAHTAQLLARFKVPQRVVQIDALPRTALGKVARSALRACAREDAGDIDGSVKA